MCMWHILIASIPHYLLPVPSKNPQHIPLFTSFLFILFKINIPSMESNQCCKHAHGSRATQGSIISLAVASFPKRSDSHSLSRYYCQWAWDLGSSSSIHAGILTGSILYWSCAGSHSCCCMHVCNSQVTLFLLSETGSHYVAQNGFKLSLQPMQACDPLDSAFSVVGIINCSWPSSFTGF